LAPITQRFQDTATYSLKPSIENCGQTAADENLVTIASAQRYHCQPCKTYCLATIPTIGIPWCTMTLQGHHTSMIFMSF